MSLPFFTGNLGIAPALEEVISQPNDGSVARWSHFLSGGSRAGREFGAEWTNLKADAQERCNFLKYYLDGTILSADASSAGDGALDGHLHSSFLNTKS